MYDVNVTSKNNKQKNVEIFLFGWHREGHWRKESDPDSGMDPDPSIIKQKQ